MLIIWIIFANGEGSVLYVLDVGISKDDKSDDFVCVSGNFALINDSRKLSTPKGSSSIRKSFFEPTELQKMHIVCLFVCLFFFCSFNINLISLPISVWKFERVFIVHAARCLEHFAHSNDLTLYCKMDSKMDK